MARAVRSTSASGRRLLRTSTYPAAPSTARTISPTTSSMRTSRPMAASSPSQVGPDDQRVAAGQLDRRHPPVPTARPRARSSVRRCSAARPPRRRRAGASPSPDRPSAPVRTARSGEHDRVVVVRRQAGDVHRARLRGRAAPAGTLQDAALLLDARTVSRSSASRWSCRYVVSSEVAAKPVADRATATRATSRADQGDPQRHPRATADRSRVGSDHPRGSRRV